MSKRTLPLKRSTEDKSTYNAAVKQGKTELRRGLADILRAELAVLLDEHTRQLAIEPLIAPVGLETSFLDAVKQNHDYIRDEMIKRLRKPDAMGENAPTAWQIDHYLAQVSSIMQTLEARGESVSALPYINRRYFIAEERSKPIQKKRGRKANQPKRGKRHPVKIGKDTFESIEEANRQTKLGRRFIQYNYATKDNEL